MTLGCEHYRKAYFVRKQLAAEAPEVQALRADFAVSTANLGNALRNQEGKEEEAEQLLRESVKLGKQIVAKSPKIAVQRHKLAIAQ